MVSGYRTGRNARHGRRCACVAGSPSGRAAGPAEDGAQRRPVGLLAIAVLHFIPEGEAVITALREIMAPGSFLALSTGTHEGLTPEQREQIENAYAKSSAPAVIRSRAEIERLFTGFYLVEPGLVHVAEWRADGPETQGRLLAGVGRLRASAADG